MKKQLFILALLPAMAMVVSCSDDDRKDIAAGAKNIVGEPKLQGTFTSQCGSSDALDLSQNLKVVFRGNKITQTQTFYEEENCSAEPIGYITYEGDFKVDEKKIEGSKVKTIDVKFDQVQVKPEKEALVKALNGVNFCGQDNYQVGKEVDISGKSGNALCFVSKVPQTFYGTYALDDGDLYFGSGTILDMAQEPDEREADVKKEDSQVYKK